MTKIFGKGLFEKKLPPMLYDFAQHGLLQMSSNYGAEYIQEVATQVYAVGPGETAPGKKVVAKKKAPEPPKLTPKEVYTLKTLNKPEFAINCDPAYLTQEIDTLKLKAEVLGTEPKPKKSRRGATVDFIDVPHGFGTGATRYGRLEAAMRYTWHYPEGTVKDFVKWFNSQKGV